MDEPSTNGENGGRDGAGRFAKGNPGGPGNPHARRVAAMRAVLLNAVSDTDLRAIAVKLVELAKGGDLAAIRELLNRMVGKAERSSDPDRIELEAEELAAALKHRRDDNEWQKAFGGFL